jgi:hypothetical protein
MAAGRALHWAISAPVCPDDGFQAFCWAAIARNENTTPRAKIKDFMKFRISFQNVFQTRCQSLFTQIQAVGVNQS